MGVTCAEFLGAATVPDKADWPKARLLHDKKKDLCERRKGRGPRLHRHDLPQMAAPATAWRSRAPSALKAPSSAASRNQRPV